MAKKGNRKTCKVEVCERDRRYKKTGYCQAHYAYWHQYGKHPTHKVGSLGHHTGSKRKPSRIDPNKLTEAEKGWVAGIIDGEGCIYLSHRTNRSNEWRIVVTSTTKPLIDKLNNLTVASVRKRDMENHKDQYIWTMTRMNDLVDFCRMVVPHLTIKKRKALDLIEDLRE